MIPDAKIGAILATGGVIAVQLAENVHELAGTAGDIVLVGGAGSLIAAILRRVWRATRKAWDGIDRIVENTDVVPEIATKLDSHMLETRKRFEALELRMDVDERIREQVAADLHRRS